MEEVTSVAERVAWLRETYDLSEKNAKALILAELGYSHSGIASKLGVTEGTAQTYLNRLETRIGQGVTESLPKSRRYPTFPGDTPKDEVPYAGDYIDYAPEFKERERPINRGPALKEIPDELVTIAPSVEVA